jgi:hypothetical protein
MSRPLQLSAETAVRLAKELKIPLEHLMHMPRHILLQKMAELAKTSPGSTDETESGQNRQQGSSHDPV